MSRIVSLLFFIFIVFITLTKCEEAEPSHEGEEDSPEEKCEEEHGGADVVLVLFFMLLLGLVARYALRAVPVPYTALLLVFGLLLGFMEIHLTRPEGGYDAPSTAHGVDVQGHDRWEKFARGIDAWQRIQPELLLLVFLPALIFSSAFSLDFHITKRSFGQVLVLAGPGVVIGTVLTGLFVKYAFPYEWCWPKAFMFGAMISATDPVAVVALLKEVGASKRLGTVIEGESLFNDGTAFVFFLLFRDMIPNTEDCLKDNCLQNESDFYEDEKFKPEGCLQDRNFGESVEFFFQLAFGGPAIGILFGLAATFWIQYIYNDLLTEISITLVTAYLTFYVAEDVAEVSGVLAVVALGLFMGSFAKDRISSTVHEPMHVFWEMMEYLANTLIFVFTGLKVAVELFEAEGDEGEWIGSREWGFAVALYLVLQVIRLITIFSLLPMLQRMGYGMTWKDALVATWGGLRGAVGLALALIIELDEDNIPASFRSYTIFYLGFVVIATLLVNGTTMPYLLKALGITKSSPEKLEVLFHLVAEMEDCGRKRALDSEDHLLGSADQEEIMKLTELDVKKIMPDSNEMNAVILNASQGNKPAALTLHMSLARQSISQVGEETEAEIAELTANKAAEKRWSWTWFKGLVLMRFERKRIPDSPQFTTITQEMLVQDMRYRLLQGVKTVYAEWLEKGYITAPAMFDLIESTDEAIDCLDSPICDWKFLKKLGNPPQWRFDIQEWKGRFLRGPAGDVLDKTISKFLFRSLSEFVLLIRTFIMAHCEAEHTLHEHIKTEANLGGIMEDEGAMEKLEKAANQVIEESKQACDEAYQKMRHFKAQYPEIVRAIKTRLSAMEVLLEKQNFLEGIERAGLIENREAGLIRDMLDCKVKYIWYHALHLDLPLARDLLACHPLFVLLHKNVFETQVLHIAKKKSFKENERIFSMGDDPQHVTFIVRGRVKMTSTDQKDLIMGDHSVTAVGVAEVMLQRPRIRTVVCETAAESYQLDKKQFLALVEKFEPVKLCAWQLTCMILTVVNPWGDFIGKAVPDIFKIFRNSDLLELEIHKEMKIRSAAYLVEGTVSEAGFDHSREITITAPAPLGPGLGIYLAKTDVKILRIPKEKLSPVGLRTEATPGRRMLARSSTTLQRMSTPVMFPPTRGTDVSEQAGSSTLIDIPEHRSPTGYSTSLHTFGRSRYSIELQPTRGRLQDRSSMSASLGLRDELGRAILRSRRPSVEF